MNAEQTREPWTVTIADRAVVSSRGRAALAWLRFRDQWDRLDANDRAWFARELAELAQEATATP